jgi:hypothetical protein
MCSFRTIPEETGKQTSGHEGDFNVSNAVYRIACVLDAGIFRFSRCWWVDPHAVNSCGDLFSGASDQRS